MSGTVSVVIATYNRPVMVGEAIQSAMAQTLPPDEIVVVDDASTDSTPEALAAVATHDARLHVHRRPFNSGGVAVWNEAAGHSSGDFIALCTDDDRFLPDHLEASVGYLRLHPEIGLVHSSFIDAIESGPDESFEPRRLRSQAPLKITRDNLIAYMARYYDWPFHPSTLVLRREVWVRTGGFDPRYSLADTDWFVRAVEQFPAVMLPRHGVYNRRHAGNWSNRLGSARMQREIFQIVEELIGRVYDGRPFRRASWNTLWRTDARMHLLLTMLARIKTGHSDAACSAWHGVLQDTGRYTPVWIENFGERCIRRACLGRDDAPPSPRQSVSPL